MKSILFDSKVKKLIALLSICYFAISVFIVAYCLYVYSYLVIHDKYLDHKIECNTDDHLYKTEEINKNSGCLIYQDGKVIVLKGEDSIVHRIRKLNGVHKISLPGGTANKNENSVCTAYRETLEESGIKTKIIDKIKVYNDRDFHLYLCKPLKKIDDNNLNYTKKFEIEKVMLEDLESVRLDETRFPEQTVFALNWVKENKEYLDSEYQNL